MEIEKILAAFTLAAALTATAFGQTGPLEPNTQKFIDALNAKGDEPIYKLPTAEARNILESLQSQPVNKPDAKIEDLTIPGGPTNEIALRIVRPAKDAGAAACSHVFPRRRLDSREQEHA